MLLFSITRYGKTYEVHKTSHTKEARAGQGNSRDHNYTEEKLKEILYEAVGSLSQYRNKGVTAVTFKNEFGRTNALLCDLYGNHIDIITMVEHTKRYVNDVFYGAHNVFLKDYIFVRPSKEDIKIDKFDSADLMIKEVKNFKSQRGKIKKVVKKKKPVVSVVPVSQTEIDEFLTALK